MAESKALLEDKDELDVLSFDPEASAVPLMAQLKVEGEITSEEADARRETWGKLTSAMQE